MNVLTCTSADVTAMFNCAGSIQPVTNRFQTMRTERAVECTRRAWVRWLGPWLFLAIFICSSTKGQTVIATVPAGQGPTALAVNPRTNKIYVADFNGNTNGITVIDGKTNTTKTLTTIAGQTAVAVNPFTNKIYFVDAYNYLTVVDGSNDTVAATVTVGLDPVAVAVNPEIGRAHV